MPQVTIDISEEDTEETGIVIGEGIGLSDYGIKIGDVHVNLTFNQLDSLFWALREWLRPKGTEEVEDTEARLRKALAALDQYRQAGEHTDKEEFVPAAAHYDEAEKLRKELWTV